MRGVIRPLPQYAFMAWCSIKSTGTTFSEQQWERLILTHYIRSFFTNVNHNLKTLLGWYWVCGPFNSGLLPYCHNIWNRLERNDRWHLHHNVSSFYVNFDIGTHYSSSWSIKLEYKRRAFLLSFVIRLHAGCGMDRRKKEKWTGFQSKIYFISLSVSLKGNYLRTPAETTPLLAFYYAVNFINETKLLSISGTGTL